MSDRKDKATLPVKTKSQHVRTHSKCHVSKKLKLIAGILFVMAFISQNTLSEHWSEKEKVLQEALTGFVHAHASSMLLINIFFSGSTATGRVQNEIIEKAANEAGHGLTMLVAVTDLPKEERETRMREIMAKAAKVKDLDSCIEYLTLADVTIKELSDDVAEHLRKIIRWKEIALWIYGLVYVVASIVAIVGIKYEES